jgi:hypothetical protein
LLINERLHVHLDIVLKEVEYAAGNIKINELSLILSVDREVDEALNDLVGDVALWEKPEKLLAGVQA